MPANVLLARRSGALMDSSSMAVIAKLVELLDELAAGVLILNAGILEPISLEDQGKP